MSNFRRDIEDELAGEAVEAVVYGTHRGWSNKNALPRATEVMSWQDAATLFDYEYDEGYGIDDCHAVWIWTATRVLFIGCYDGKTWVTSVPRNPSPGEPYMVGGG